MNKQHIEQLAAEKTITTVTVDVFDTLLLRKTWPEDLQFLAHAKACLPALHQYISSAITAYEFYSFRQYARRVWYAGRAIAIKTEKVQPDSQNSSQDDFTSSLLSSDPEISIEAWFELTVGMLAEKYGVALPQTNIQNLARQLIDIELKVECQYLKPNRDLISWLEKLKHTYGIRIYFLSDMYLRSPHINTLFKNFNMQNLFAGGASSSDLGAGKWNGKVFAHLTINKIFDDFELGKNVHIGDNRISDHAMPLQAGSNAMHYRSPYVDIYRRLHDKAGRKKLAIIQYRARREARKAYFGKASKTHTVRQDLSNIGKIFAVPTISYLEYVLYRSKVSKEHLFFVSSEAAMFDEYAQALHSTGFLRGAYDMALKVNRKNVLAALLYRLGKQSSNGQMSGAFEDLMRYGEKLSSRQDMLSFITGDSQPKQSTLALEHISSKQFTNYMFDEVQQQVKKSSSKLKTVSELVDAQLRPVLDSRVVSLVDVGWGGSVQMFLQNYLQNTKHADIALRGMYIGAFKKFRFKAAFQHSPEGIVLSDVESKEDRPLFVPWIWEYVYTNKHKNDNKLPYIQQGIADGIMLYKQSVHVAPNEMWQAGRGQLVRLFVKPTRREVGLLGSVTIDSGFNRSEMIPMVSTGSSVRRQYLTLLTKPKTFYRKITAEYCWTAGFITWYRMGWIEYLLPLASRMKRFVKH